jgi:hypothetical protein
MNATTDQAALTHQATLAWHALQECAMVLDTIEGENDAESARLTVLRNQVQQASRGLFACLWPGVQRADSAEQGLF